MKLEVGKAYLTRAGYKVFVVWKQATKTGTQYLVIHEDLREPKYSPLIFRPPFVHSEDGRVFFRFASQTPMSAIVDEGWCPYRVPHLYGFFNDRDGSTPSELQQAWYATHTPQFAEDIVTEWTEK